VSTAWGHPPPGPQHEIPLCEIRVDPDAEEPQPRRDEPRRRGRGCRRRFSPLDVAEHLRVAQEPAEVDVKHVAGGLEHDVVIVPVADPQHVGGHAAASTGVDEVLHGLRGGREGWSHQARRKAGRVGK